MTSPNNESSAISSPILSSNSSAMNSPPLKVQKLNKGKKKQPKSKTKQLQKRIIIQKRTTIPHQMSKKEEKQGSRNVYNNGGCILNTNVYNNGTIFKGEKKREEKEGIRVV